jgi:hypothetical protein
MNTLLEADLWLSYGSFCYGLETVITSVQEEAVAFRLQPHQLDKARHLNSRPTEDQQDQDQDIQRFLQTVRSRSRFLLRSDLRIYLDTSFPSSLDLGGSTIQLTSPLPPEWVSQSDQQRGALQLRGLAAVRSIDALLWREVVARGWPAPS